MQWRRLRTDSDHATWEQAGTDDRSAGLLEGYNTSDLSQWSCCSANARSSYFQVVSRPEPLFSRFPQGACITWLGPRLNHGWLMWPTDCATRSFMPARCLQTQYSLSVASNITYSILARSNALPNLADKFYGVGKARHDLDEECVRWI